MVATDGCARDGLGAFAIVVHQPACVFSLGAFEEDQTPFKQELHALWHLATAAAALARTGSTGDVIVLSDCRSALDCAALGRSAALPGLAESTMMAFMGGPGCRFSIPVCLDSFSWELVS